MEFILGVMEVFTLVIGFPIKQKASVNLNLQMDVISWELGKIINCMGLENINGQTGQNILVNILMIYRMAKEISIGKMEKSMKDKGKKVNSMAKEGSQIKKQLLTQVYGATVNSNDGQMKCKFHCKFKRRIK